MPEIEGTSIYGLPARVKSSVADLANAWIPYEDLSGDPVDTFRMTIDDLLTGVTVEAQAAVIVYSASHGLTSGSVGKPIGWKADGKPYVWTDTATTEIPVAVVQAITDSNHLQIAAIGPLAEVANTLLPASLPVYSGNTNSRMLFWDTSAGTYKHITQGDAMRDLRLVYWVGLKEGDANTSVVVVLPPGVDGSAKTVIANVRDFGAMQDSTTDDTAAIQAAINSDRPLVYFPGSPTAAYYKTTDTLTLNNNNQHVYGDGPSSIIHCTANDKNIFYVQGTSATARVEGISISRLWLKGINATDATPATATSTALGTAITVYCGHRIQIRDCLITHCHCAGVFVYYSSDVVIENNWFFDQYWRYVLNYATSDIHIWYENENVVIRGNHCHSNGLHIVADGLQNESIEILDNICYAADDEGNVLAIGRGPLSGTSSDDTTTVGRHNIMLMYTDPYTIRSEGRAIVRGNLCYGGTWTNIYYNADNAAPDDIGHRVIIADNIFLNGAGCVGGANLMSGAICVHAGREVAIHDNLIIDPWCRGGHGSSAAIQLWKAHDGGQWSIRGNIITNCPADGIKITNRAHHLLVADNYIYNCGYRNFSGGGAASIRLYETTLTIAGEVGISSISTATNTLTASGTHGLTLGDHVRFTGTATTFPKFAGGIWDKQTMFWVRDVSGNDFKLSAEPRGDAIDITATFSGGTLNVLRTQFLGGSMIVNNMIVENVTQKLGSEMAFPASDVNAGTDRIYWLAHGFGGGEKIIFNNATPANLFAIGGSTVQNDTAYFVRYVDADYIELASTAGGAKLDITAAGSDTHTMRLVCGENYGGIIHAMTNGNAPDIIRGNSVITRGARVWSTVNIGIMETTANKSVVISDNYVEGYYYGIYAGDSHTSALQNDIIIQNNNIRDCYEGFYASGNTNAIVLIDDSNRLNSGVSWRHRTTGAYCTMFGSMRNGKLTCSLPYNGAKSATTNSTDTFSSTSHGFTDGMRVQLSGTIPTNFSASTNYYVRDAASGTFKLSATRTGSAITAGSTVSSGLTVTHQLPNFGTWSVGDTIVNESWTKTGDPREWVCTTAGAIGTCVWRPTSGVITVLANSDSTPDTTNAILLVTANEDATSITGFDGGAVGQRLILFCNDSFTTLKQNAAAGSETPLYLAGWRDQTPNNGMSYEFVKTYLGTTLYWVQVNQNPQTSVATAAASDATPSVFGLQVLKTANAAGTTITNFDDGWEGQELTLFVNDANTTIDHGASGPIKLASGADETCSLGDVFRFINVGGIWYEQTTTAAT